MYVHNVHTSYLDMTRTELRHYITFYSLRYHTDESFTKVQQFNIS